MLLIGSLLAGEQLSDAESGFASKVNDNRRFGFASKVNDNRRFDLPQK